MVWWKLSRSRIYQALIQLQCKRQMVESSTVTHFYIYIHRKPDGTPFYVGKGHGDRADWRYTRTPYHTSLLKKYGDDVIVEIINCESEKIAFECEVLYIQRFREEGYRLANMTDGGDGPTGLVMTIEAREKMALAKRGKKQSPELLERRVQGMIGRKMSPGYSEKLSARWKGVPKPLEQRAKIAKSLTGTRDTEERKINKRKAALGKTKARNTSGLCGVSWSKDKQAWDVRMKVRDELYRKRFKCLLDAAAYQSLTES